MESDQSYSDDSSNSSDSSSGSSDGEDEVMEPVRILGHTLQLPQELCEDYSVFKEFFSMKTWEDLSEEHKEHLKKFLPKFRTNDAEEKEKTIQMLFNHEPFHFTSPLGDFYNNLRQGNYRPDIAKMRKFLQKARAKQQKHKIKSYYAKLFPEVLISRERLLAAAKSAPPGPIPRIPLLPPKPSSKSQYKPVYLRVRQRYFEELSAIRGEIGGDESEDENYPEGPPEQPPKKRKNIAPAQNSDGGVLGTLAGPDSSEPNSLQCLKNVLAAHRARRQYRENHPELNTDGITLEDIKQRVALVNGAKKLMFGSQKSDMPVQKLKRGPKKEPVQKQVKASDAKGVKRKEDQLSVENKPLLPNIKIKCEQEESDSEGSSFVDPVASPPHNKKYEHVEIKQEEDVCPAKPSSNYSDPKLESMIKQEPLDPSVPMQGSTRIIHQPVPIKLEDLDGIDMMALPVEIADESGEVLQVDQPLESNSSSEGVAESSLTQTTYASFLSLVRALFPASAAHRATRRHLHASCAAVINSPIAPLNTWYNLSDNWCAELDSALEFLAGERGPHPDDFVPYLQFKPETQMYQWIGAGRDGDATLGRLCERWLRGLGTHGGTPASALPALPPPPPPPTQHTNTAPNTSADPPPPRYPTNWMVRPATSAEIEEFQAQERKRFAAPNKPFTYMQHGYRSVVGPCGRSSSVAGSALVSVSSPRAATLPALVRDALARLPNGQGTATHLLTMLRMSQWIVPCSDQVLLSAISSTLERFLTAKRDPVVKFDATTATWTYLHRHRSEEDWCKNAGRRGGRPRPATPPPPPDTTTTNVGTMEDVEEGSDIDVDVEDSGSPQEGSRLSSAQLLMRAAQYAQQEYAIHKQEPDHATPVHKVQLEHATPVQKTQQDQPTTPTHKLIPVSPHRAKAVLAKQVAHKANQGSPAKRSVTQQKSDAASPTQHKASPPTPLSPPSKPVPHLPKPSPPQPPKQPTTTPIPTSQTPKQAIPPKPQPKQSTIKQSPQAQPKPLPALMVQSAKQANLIAQLTKQPIVKQTSVIQKQANVVTSPSEPQSPSNVVNVKQIPSQQIKQVPIVKPVPAVQSPKQDVQKILQVSKSGTTLVAPSLKSPLIKQRPLQQKQVESPQAQTLNTSSASAPSVLCPQTTTVTQQSTASPTQTQVQIQNKPIQQGTRSLLIRPTAVQTTVTAATLPTPTQVNPSQRRGIVRVLSPAAAAGKSLISPRALMQQGIPATKKRPSQDSSVPTIAQSTASVTTLVNSVGTAVSSSVARTVQLGGRGARPGAGLGGALHLALPLRLNSPAQVAPAVTPPTIHLAPSHTLRIPASTLKTSPRPLQSSPKPPNVQIPLSTVQLAGQTVQIAGQTVQIAGQSVQLTGHTVKLPSGQSVQVAGQSVQLPSGQTVQLAGQSVHLTGQTVQLGGQTVQLAGQTVQLAGQTVQLPSGQTIQLASGQTVQLGQKTAQVRTQATTEKPAQPIIAKLLTNAQGQVVSVEGGVGGRAVGAGAGARVSRPLLLTGKPLHSLILQQSDGTAIRVTSSGGAATSQIVLSTIGAQNASTSTATTPVLKLQQGVSNTVATSGIRSVVMDGQQLKLVGGRHVLARILRPAPPAQPQPPPQ